MDSCPARGNGRICGRSGSAFDGQPGGVRRECGPGNLHLINGLYDANRSRVPVLAIAAHIPSYEIGSRYFQETHPESIFRECSHYCELISQAEQMPRVLEIAIQTALVKPGVAVVVLPGDVALREPINSKPRLHFPAISTTIRPSDEEIAKAAGLLNESRKVTILGGAGCAGAHTELIELAGKLKAPIVHALRGKDSSSMTIRLTSEWRVCLDFPPAIAP